MAAAAAPRPAPAISPASDYSPLCRIIILIAIMLGTILEVLDTSIVNVAIPDMQGNLGATVDQINWVSTGYILSNVIVLPLTGWLSNYFGRKLYLTGSILLFTIASFLCGTANSLTLLIIYRILQGAGGAALLSTAQATLIEIFPKEQLAQVQALFTVGIVAAPTLGPTLGGFITDNYGWPWIFYVNVPLGLIAAFLTFTYLKNSAYQTARTPIDLVGILFLAIGLGSLQTVLEKGNREGWLESQLIINLCVVAAVFLVLFVWWELRTEHPAVKLNVLRHRSFAAGSVYGFVLGFGLYGGVFILPLFLQEVQHFTAQQTGLVLLPGGLITAATLPIVGKLIGRVDSRLIVGTGTLLFIGCMLALQSININTGERDTVIPLLFRGAALSCMFLPLVFTSLAGLPSEEVSYASGIYNLARQLGGSVGIAYLSTLLDTTTKTQTANLLTHVSLNDPVTQQRIFTVQQSLVAKGIPNIQAFFSAIASVRQSVDRQASTLAFANGFHVIAISFVLALPLLFLLRRPKAAAAPVDAH